jgi:hypothetical protein
MQECSRPDAEAFLMPAVSTLPPAAVELPRPARSGLVSSEDTVTSPAPPPEILDPPPRG